MQKTYYVYILASSKNGTLYVGMTNDLARRVWEHREGLIDGFTKRFGVKVLVYFEEFAELGIAIHRETRLKSGRSQLALNALSDERYLLDGALLRATTNPDESYLLG